MIELPGPFVFAEVIGNLGTYCIHQPGQDDEPTVLCGAPLYAVTPEGWGPDGWGEVHGECVLLLSRMAVCPVCSGWAGTVEGRLVSHGGCVGVNLRVER